MNAKKITVMALLTAVSLIIFSIESQIPNFIPIPGIKLGLANIVTVYAMFALGAIPTLMILLCRILLGNILSSQMAAFLYSMAGGLLCYLSMLIMHKFTTSRQIWVCSVIAAIFHNIGQIIAAILIMKTLRIAIYFPFLLISGIISGAFTGLCAQFLLKRLPRI